MVHLKEGKVGECNIATHVKSQKVKSFLNLFIYLSLFKVSTIDIVKNYVELEISTGNDLIFFSLTAIWLPHGQLWTIMEEADSHTRC